MTDNMQTHLTMRTLKGPERPEKDVQVLFAARPNRKAILFIHGFSGDAIRTWSQFDVLLPGRPVCTSHDVLFYGYDGLRADMHASASIFRFFLCRFLEGTPTFLMNNLPPSAQRPDDFGYDELVIVAHSLGAVIARRALLDATRSKADWVKRTRLILYAPAHKGARVMDLAVEVASSFPFLRWFAIGARYKSPLLDQLKPGSRELKKLLNDTEAATENGVNSHLVAKRVIIAEREMIVYNETFGKDPPPETIPDTTHTTVCKPTRGFLQPLTFLETCL